MGCRNAQDSLDRFSDLSPQPNADGQRNQAGRANSPASNGGMARPYLTTSLS
jgi:hypothetical protein